MTQTDHTGVDLYVGTIYTHRLNLVKEATLVI